MEQLIKITSVPIQTVRLTQGARLVSSDSVDIERRKALARQISFRRTHSGGSGTIHVEDITRINRTFSRRNVTPQTQTVTRQQAVSRQQAAVHQQSISYQPIQNQAPAASSAVYSRGISAADVSAQEFIPTEVFVSAASTAAATGGSSSVSQEASASYTAQRGALEMRVSKGDLTFLPPLVMTIVTQRPELHFEYLGDFNYVPPRHPESGGNINLFT